MNIQSLLIYPIYLLIVSDFVPEISYSNEEIDNGVDFNKLYHELFSNQIICVCFILSHLIYYVFLYLQHLSINMCLSDAYMKNVERCPRNHDEWNARAIEINCSQTEESDEKDEYHCVINQTKTIFVELCAPSVSIVGL